MNAIHPNWHATDAEEVPVRAKERSSVPTRAREVSRRPAAIAGILIVIGIGFAFFRGVNGLSADLSGNDAGKTIRITAAGVEPTVLEVEHGETIMFVNESNIPHIIESDSLCSSAGYCLHTATLFFGDSDNFSITPDIPSGTYDFFSSTSGDISGQITVVTTSALETQNEFFGHGSSGTDTVPITQSIAPTAVTVREQEQVPMQQTRVIPSPPPQTTYVPQTQTQPQPQREADPAAPTSVQTGIPRNPYTVGNTRQQTLPEGTAEAMFNDRPVGSETSEVQSFRSGRGPLRQPDTGTGIWVVVLGAVIGLLTMTRKCFARM